MTPMRAAFGVVTAAAATLGIFACSLRDTSYLKSGGGPNADGGPDVVIGNDGGGDATGGGTRTASTIVSGQVSPQFLVQDDTTLYWFSDGKILAIKKDGSETAPRVVTSVVGVSALVAEAGSGPNLFFASGVDVKSVAKAGGTPASVGNTTPGARALAVDPTYVFAMADDENGDGTQPSSIVRFGHDGSGKSTVTPSDESNSLYAIALQGNDIYWDEGVNDFYSLAKNAAPDAGPTKYSATGGDIESATGPLAFAVDDTTIYYSNLTDVRAFRKATSGTAIELIGYAAEAQVHAIAIDDTFVYAIDGVASGTLRRNQKDGRGAPELMLTGLAKPSAIAVDATSVYVAVEGPPGAIVKCAK